MGVGWNFVSVWMEVSVSWQVKTCV